MVCLSSKTLRERTFPDRQRCAKLGSPDHSQSHDPIASSKALASFRSSVSKPSVNQP
jgi:hypothetical protein